LYGSAGGLRFLAPGTAPLVLAEESSSRWVEWIVPTSAGFGVVVTEEGFGTELWWTDGTPAGTGRVRDIAPGPASSIRIPFPIENSFEPPIAGKLAALGARVVFAADDGVHGEELWVSDGTEAGTFLLGDLMPGPAPSSPRDLTSAGDRLFFAAEHPALGRELWVTDGTPAGTVPVVDLVPGAGSSRPGDLAWLGDRLVFSAWTPAWGREAWRTDGTAAGTWRLTDIAPGPSSSSPGLFREVGGTLLFAANDGARGFELWGLTADGSVPLFRDTFESGGLQRWDEAAP
ncbi:MAG TPA: ELWxxDGT repeat protein, partial [Thermoanaerobaculia bacterium]|nr:ELWxxDGT repeat protein [Thermoanaerobaculia bacterium]